MSDIDIAAAIRAGEIRIEPFDERLLRRNSYLLRLAGHFRRIRTDRVIDTAVPEDYRHARGTLEDGPAVVIDPESLVLGCSVERIGVSTGIVGLLSGVSNVARLGVTVHCTSQLVNAGFSYTDPGCLVFELATLGRMHVRLHAGTPLCHLIFARLESPTTDLAPSRRHAQHGPDASTLLAQFGAFYAS